MSDVLTKSYGYRLNTPYNAPAYYTITTDRAEHLRSDSPIFDSIPELYAHLLTLHPSPDPNLSFLVHDSSSPDDFSWYTRFTIADEPVYCGPESEHTLKTLLFRYRRILVRDSPFFSSLQPPFHLNTKVTWISGTKYRTLIFSTSISTRTQTRRDNIASARSSLLSPSSLPVPLFPPLRIWTEISADYGFYHVDDPLILHPKKAELAFDYRGDILFAVAKAILNNFHSFLSLADLHPYFRTPWLAPLVARHFRDGPSFRELARTLVPFLPWFPHLADTSLLLSSDPQHTAFVSFLRSHTGHSYLTSSASNYFFALIPTRQHSHNDINYTPDPRHFYELDNDTEISRSLFIRIAFSRFLRLYLRCHPSESLSSLRAPLDNPSPSP